MKYQKLFVKKYGISMNYFSDADKRELNLMEDMVICVRVSLKKISWFRVGGSAELLFKPKDLMI